MRFPQSLIKGVLLRRYARFIAEVRLQDGRVVQAHCPNTGRMTGVADPGLLVMLSPSSNPRRKLKYTWEMVRVGEMWVGINTLNANRLVHEALLRGEIPELSAYTGVRKEAVIGGHSRVDFILKSSERLCYVEVKNVHLAQEGIAYFPDAVTVRGRKHLTELVRMVTEGHRGVMFYVVQREDARLFRPADHIDPAYGLALRKAHRHGVEIIPYRARVSPREISLTHRIEFELPEL